MCEYFELKIGRENKLGALNFLTNWLRRSRQLQISMYLEGG